MDNMKLRVTCTASKLVALNDMHPLQGDLKSLSETSFEKLKASILKYGVAFPFFCWRNGGKLWICDGTQRDRVLHKLRDEGYQIPKLPVDFIQAKDKKEAKEKILLLSSQYGKMDLDSLYTFGLEAHLDFEELTPILELPDINLEDFKDGYLKDETRKDHEVFEFQCPACGHSGPRKSFVHTKEADSKPAA